MSYTKHGHRNLWTPEDDTPAPVARSCGGSNRMWCRDCAREMNPLKRERIQQLLDMHMALGWPRVLARLFAQNLVEEIEISELSKRDRSNNPI